MPAEPQPCKLNNDNNRQQAIIYCMLIKVANKGGARVKEQ